MGRRIGSRHLLIALPALVSAASCVPQPPVRTAAAAPRRPAPSTLLKQLDLEIPADLAASTQPLASDLIPAVAVTAPPFLAQAATPDDAQRAIDCLTAAVYYEARSQSADGQRAVAQVVLNRVRDRAFPASVCGVVYQGSQRRTGCQFSFTCDGSLYHPREPFAWDRARSIAAAALAGAVYAPVGAATFYHADYVSPWWAGSMARVATIGAHIFYRWRGAMENALAFRQSYSGAEPLAAGRWTPSTVPAVEVHYGGETASGETTVGVMIHRGAATIDAPDAPPVRATVTAGVRIHRTGGDLPPVEAAIDDTLAKS
ncbi:cell wall hydrolase [Sphingomonas koreensis]|nr:cell wall hydrolase [Sphingomonas koreensis]